MSDAPSPRTLFGQPIRSGTTEAFYREPLTLDEFVIFMHQNVDGFATNMRMYPDLLKSKYIERWAELFLAWSEIEPE